MCVRFIKILGRSSHLVELRMYNIEVRSSQGRGIGIAHVSRSSRGLSWSFGTPTIAGWPGFTTHVQNMERSPRLRSVIAHGNLKTTPFSAHKHSISTTWSPQLPHACTAWKHEHETYTTVLLEGRQVASYISGSGNEENENTHPPL